MRINAYLNFKGDCAEAIKFYEKILGGQIVATMTFGQSPMASMVPADWQDKILHTRLQVGDQTLMASDAMPDNYQTPAGVTVALNVDNAAEAERIFAALSEGATIHMPMGKTFWAERFGGLVDKYGIPWMVNCEKSIS